MPTCTCDMSPPSPSPVVAGGGRPRRQAPWAVPLVALGVLLAVGCYTTAGPGGRYHHAKLQLTARHQRDVVGAGGDAASSRQLRGVGAEEVDSSGAADDLTATAGLGSWGNGEQQPGSQPRHQVGSPACACHCACGWVPAGNGTTLWASLWMRMPCVVGLVQEGRSCSA